MEIYKKYLTKSGPGELLYKSGENQEFFYIINKGRVQLKSEDGRTVLIALAKGDFFGEECFNSEQAAMCSAETVEETSIIKLPFNVLQEMMKKSPEITSKILKKLATKNAKITETLLTQQEKIEMDKYSESTDNLIIAAEKLPDTLDANIVIKRSNRKVQLVKLNTYIGRRDYTTGFIPDIDLTQEDEEKYISRKHALISYVDGKFYFSEESGAINGTFLNGTKLNTGVKYQLNPGDEMTLCHLNVIFNL